MLITIDTSQQATLRSIWHRCLF